MWKSERLVGAWSLCTGNVRDLYNNRCICMKQGSCIPQMIALALLGYDNLSREKATAKK